MHHQMMLAVCLVCAALAPARAELTRSDVAGVEASPRPGAVLPLSVRLRDENGVARPIRQWLTGGPSVWVLADFTCDTLCGSVVSTVSDALRRSGLRPGQDFDLNVVSFDPQDTAENAKEMKQAQVGLQALGDATHVLRGDASDVVGLTKAFGFEAVYDRDQLRYAHPAAAFVVTADGRIARALPGLGLDPANLRLALVEAGQGRIGGWTDHVRLMCYGFDPASGLYTLAVGRLLKATGLATLVLLGLLIVALLRHEREAARS
ncbi:protein SCO1/2 [Bradyrhizobium elkanii]|jgi:protein SCO1|uniref:SCO family protein n=2 Tax=Nitrobacteraceae TaxID=41294 RepID=UPI0006881BC6|nr:SCO family protein [Bradyrhizobium elkanii]MCS3523090.1 protein SCO1/2 [Bradyrhizobium elkanii]MCS4070743.1 protein SCO1/2 [Bradyrhizobium elkanii]MCW2170772.1 protein SCO1/2 [Bradyrhizobium elkanii]MDH6688973.1 protein SCO1/2 [Bradyrhizobium elkanii]